METSDFRNCVLKLYAGFTPLVLGGYGLEQAWLLAPGIMLVLDMANEFDLYFDPERWWVRCPEIWPSDALEPPDLIGTGLRVIELVDHRQIVCDALTAKMFAQSELVAVGTPRFTEFYRAPLAVRLNR